MSKQVEGGMMKGMSSVIIVEGRGGKEGRVERDKIDDVWCSI